MSVSLLLIAHAPLGQALLEVTRGTLGVIPLPHALLDVVRDTEPELVRQRARELVAQLDQGDGVLVLTDIYGSTPSNIACALQDVDNVRIVAGLNLPMMIRVMNYAGLDLPQLTDKAISGGHDGILGIDPAFVQCAVNHTASR
jgi:PTS system ascorbate-specific IIA component